MIRTLLAGIKQNLIYVVIASLVLGLVAGQVAGESTKRLLQAAIVPVLFLMIYPMMITIDIGEIIHIRGHLRHVGLSLLLNFGVAPAVALGLANTIFAGSPEYAVGLYFIALIPTSGMTAAWTGLAGGDLEAALVAMAVNLLAAVVVLPAYLGTLVPASVHFDPSALYRQLAVVVVGPMIAGALTRRAIFRSAGQETFERLKPTFGGLSSFGVMLIVFIAMAMRSTKILADPVASASTIVPLLLFYIVILGAAIGAGTLLSEGERIALVYATSMRNLSIAVAIVVATEAIPAAAVLPIALAYIVQPPLGAVYMHYRRDVIGNGLSLREAATRLI